MSFQPHTPQSPSQCSPSSAEPFPLSNPMASTSNNNTLPTPAHSVNGSASQATVSVDMLQDATTSGGEDSPFNKRKRALEDTGDRASKKVHVENFKLGIEDLHLDVGEKYLLCKTPHTRHLSRTPEDLFELFGLTDLVAQVAREKPNGEKNALRKTYKGQIKKVGISGNFDAVKTESNDPNGFMMMVMAPELEWDVHEAKGREVADGLSEAVLSSLSRAMTMSRGTVPKNIWDGAVLNESAKLTKPVVGTPMLAATASTGRLKATSTDGLLQQGAATPNLQAKTPTVPELSRPRRAGKKREYNDSSFEGYGEGFPDDDAGPDAGYSTGDGEDRGSHKRRKKHSGSGQAFPGVVRQSSYGPGMVGA